METAAQYKERDERREQEDGLVQGGKTPLGRTQAKRPLLRDRVQQLMDHHGLTQADVSEQTGLSRSVVSQWLGGKYPHAGDVIPAMKAWVVRVSGGSREDFLFVDTVNSKRVFEACEWARRERRIALVVGRPGLGKTVALREFHRRQVLAGEELMYHFVSPAIKQHSLAKMMCRRFELSERGTTYDLLESLVAKLRRKPVFMLFDEANHLNVPCLEALRYLYDQVQIPMVLCGSIQLQRTLSDGGDRQLELEQLQSRIGLRVMLNPLTSTEVGKVLRVMFGEELHPDLVREFHAQSRGITRDLVNGVTNARGILEINRKRVPDLVLDREIVELAFKRQLMS